LHWKPTRAVRGTDRAPEPGAAFSGDEAHWPATAVGFYIWVQGPEKSSGNYVKTSFELLSHSRWRDKLSAAIPRTHPAMSRESRISPCFSPSALSGAQLRINPRANPTRLPRGRNFPLQDGVGAVCKNHCCDPQALACHCFTPPATCTSCNARRSGAATAQLYCLRQRDSNGARDVCQPIVRHGAF
jgi:hypothetical protein